MTIMLTVFAVASVGMLLLMAVSRGVGVRAGMLPADTHRPLLFFLTDPLTQLPPGRPRARDATASFASPLSGLAGPSPAFQRALNKWSTAVRGAAPGSATEPKSAEDSDRDGVSGLCTSGAGSVGPARPDGRLPGKAIAPKLTPVSFNPLTVWLLAHAAEG